jgi:hypothetical protein
MTIFQRLWNVIRPRRVNDEIQQEMETHLALLEEEEQSRGVSGGEAQRIARQRFGNTTRTAEKTREMDLLGWLETGKKDLFYAARVLRKSPAFTVFALLAIALGIGSTTLMFSILNSLVLQPPPFPYSNRLYMVWQRLPQEDRVSLSTKEFLAWQTQSAVFERLGAFTGNGFTITGHGDPELVIGQMVTPSFFDILGVGAALGRTFLPTEGEAGRNLEVVLSSQLWRNKFSARTDIVGQTIMMSGSGYTVVGVMPPDFDFPGRDYKLWVPAALTGPPFERFPDAHLLRVLGRIKPGVTAARIEAELDTLPKRLNPDDTISRRYYAASLKDAMNGDLRRPLIVLMLAVGFLLHDVRNHAVDSEAGQRQSKQREARNQPGAESLLRYGIANQALHGADIHHHLRIERTKRSADRRAHSHTGTNHIVVVAAHKLHQSWRKLRVRHVDLRVGRRVQFQVLDVGADSGYRQPFCVEPDAFPDRTFIRPEALGEKPIDYGDVGRLFGIHLREIAAFEQRNPHRPEVSRTAGADLCDVVFSRRRRMSLDLVTIAPTVSAEGKMGDHPNRGDAGQRAKTRKRLAVELQNIGALRICFVAERDARCRKPRGPKAGIHIGQRHEAANHQPATNQQHRGERNFHKNKSAAPAVRSRARSGARTLLEIGMEIVARSGKGRYEARQDARRSRDQKGEAERPRINTSMCELWNVLRAERRQQPQTRNREDQAECAASESEQYRFRKQLPHQAPTARAQSATHRHFLMPRARPG